MASPGKKSYPLRIDPELWAEIERLAAQELRSANAQVEYLLREALARRGRKPKPPSTDEGGKAGREPPRIAAHPTGATIGLRLQLGQQAARTAQPVPGREHLPVRLRRDRAAGRTRRPAVGARRDRGALHAARRRAAAGGRGAAGDGAVVRGDRRAPAALLLRPRTPALAGARGRDRRDGQLRARRPLQGHAAPGRPRISRAARSAQR